MKSATNIPKLIKNAISEGALFIVNHSGGKDSQAMYIYLTQDLKIPFSQIRVVHAELPGVDWEGSLEHIERNIDGLELHTCESQTKTFMSMVRSRGKFPSASCRQCTSDLKRDPIAKVIRRLSAEVSDARVINCMGIRAQESTARAKKDPLVLDNRLSKAGRIVYNWLPIFKWSVDEVFARIATTGQAPFWTYARGMTRKSCKFCILASQADLRCAAKIDPEAAAEMVALETEIGFTFQNGKSLADILAQSQINF